GSQVFLEHHLSLKTCVIRPWQIQRFPSLHAHKADQSILDCILVAVSNVQVGIRIWRRHQNNKGFATWFWRECPALFPELINHSLILAGFVYFWQLHYNKLYHLAQVVSICSFT